MMIYHLKLSLMKTIYFSILAICLALLVGCTKTNETNNDQKNEPNFKTEVPTTSHWRTTTIHITPQEVYCISPPCNCTNVIIVHGGCDGPIYTGFKSAIENDSIMSYLSRNDDWKTPFADVADSMQDYIRGVADGTYKIFLKKGSYTPDNEVMLIFVKSDVKEESLEDHDVLLAMPVHDSLK
jgi:hypothetical protein